MLYRKNADYSGLEIYLDNLFRATLVIFDCFLRLDLTPLVIDLSYLVMQKAQVIKNYRQL